MAKAKKDVFSVAKVVKNNARLRLGTPPPVVTIPECATKGGARSGQA